MRSYFTPFLLILSCFSASLKAQRGPVTQDYPNTLKLEGDKFEVLFSSSAKPSPLTAVVGDTVDWGGDGYPDAYAVIITGQDSVRISYTNAPFNQQTFVPLDLPNGRATYSLRFNGVSGQFSDEYVQEHTGKAEFEIPEVYELANILWILSDHGQKNASLPKSGAYYQQVLNHFRPFLNHPAIQQLNQVDGSFTNYYDFRENSYTYRFEKDNLVRPGPHYYVMGKNWETFESLFQELVPKIEDFASKSGYRAFYKGQIPYYEKLIDKQKQLMPVRTMWDWLEARFPQRFECYRVVFSPLIGGSHSTQQYGRFVKGKLYREAVMFVNGPEQYTKLAELNDQQRQGLASAIVFTEIDHNYVNSTTSRFRNKVDSVFSKRSIWTKEGGDTDNYGTPESIFNEYMTHALFCLYVRDQYGSKTADYLVDQRDKLMVERRQYARFKEFRQKVEELYSIHKTDSSIAGIYPALLQWAEKVE